jgi:hypothetical protein
MESSDESSDDEIDQLVSNMDKQSRAFIERSHLPRCRHRVTSEIMLLRWPRHIICNLIELGANLIRLNMMRSNVATRSVILVYETLSN